MNRRMTSKGFMTASVLAQVLTSFAMYMHSGYENLRPVSASCNTVVNLGNWSPRSRRRHSEVINTTEPNFRSVSW